MSPTSFQTALSRDNITYPASRLELDGEGFEPSKASLTDLQSAPFGHSGTHPFYVTKSDINGAYRARTYDPLLVRQMLSQLS